MHGEIWIEFYILKFHEHGCLQPCRPYVTLDILHMRHSSMPLTVSGQGKGMYVNSNNRKGDHDLGGSILQTQSVF